MTDTQTLLLVDGSSYLFRAYHALPDLRNKAGEPTGAIHGMVGMLRRLRDDTRLHGGATLGAVIFDAPGRTFRDDLYEHYKANRSQTPEALVAQIAPIHELTQALGWPLLVVPGIEADDVIGTLATRARAAGMRTVISTGDKDLAQLVDDETLLVNTMTRDGVPPTVMDAAGVRDKFGVDPGQIIDFLTLTGDAVDNVPGVDKVGPKTAAKWLNEYGSLDAILQNADQIKGKVGENLRAARDWLPRGRELVTVLRDADLSAWVGGVETLKLRPEDEEALLGLFDRWELRTFARRLVADRQRREAGTGHVAGTAGAAAGEGTSAGQGTSGQVSASAAGSQAGRGAAGDGTAGLEALPGGIGHFTRDGIVLEAPPAGELQAEMVTTRAALDAWLARVQAADRVAVDTETTSLDPRRGWWASRWP